MGSGAACLGVNLHTCSLSHGPGHLDDRGTQCVLHGLLWIVPKNNARCLKQPGTQEVLSKCELVPSTHKCLLLFFF